MLSKKLNFSIFSSLAFSTLLVSILQAALCAAKQSYIVYLGQQSAVEGPSSLDDRKFTQSHYALLQSVSPSQIMDLRDPSENPILYSYTKCMDGFAAVLDEDQAEKLRGHPRVKAVFPNTKYELHTTHSWDFLGLGNHGAPAAQSIWKQANFGENIIIANVDTGVWPENPSFNDDGMGPVPTKWKGICQTDGGVRCNKKLIGARYFYKGLEAELGPMNSSLHTARDEEGHGSHTLSTAGGSFVRNASIFGYGTGTASGGSPKARVAAYKVCWDGGCFAADILAAFDAALSDGVDVISVSLGGSQANLYRDTTALGSFNAIRKGIPVIASGGNSGPDVQTISNVAPWLFTIAASTTDRDFTSNVVLGDKTILKGTSLSDKALPAGKQYPLVNSMDAKAANATESDAQVCLAGSLDRTKVAGKIVVCLRGISGRLEKGQVVAGLGAAGLIIANDVGSGNEIISDPHFIPATHISYDNGQTVLNYIRTTPNATGTITPIVSQVGVKPAPVMAAFSSRGPNPLFPGILKPDVTAPGVNILAAFSGALSPTELDSDPRRVPYTTMSGTSMSCPHVSGIVGLLKSIHPDWSPAAIKSAIMTTATTLSNTGKPILDADDSDATPFIFGAGHVQPNLAADPGLVYDSTVNDFLNCLCAIGYNETIVKSFSEGPYTCPKNFTLVDFNYPSITVPDLSTPVVAIRRLKNVGAPGTYKVTANPPTDVSVVVEPSQLSFTQAGEEKEFKITFKSLAAGMPQEYAFGDIVWSDGKHNVRSPLVVKHA